MTKQESINRLREILKPGDIVYTTLRHVSRSRMQRVVDLYAIQGNRPIWLSGYCATAGVAPSSSRRQGLIVRGVGLDVGFELVYALSEVLWPGKKCSLNHEWL